MTPALKAGLAVGVITAVATLPMLLPMYGGGLVFATVFIGPIAAGLTGGAIARTGRAVFASVGVAVVITLIGMWVGGMNDRRTLFIAAGEIATVVAMGHFTALAVRRPAVHT